MKQSIRSLTIMGILLLSACQQDRASVTETLPQAETTEQTSVLSSESEDSDSELIAQSSEEPISKDVNYCYHNGLEYESIYLREHAEYIEIDGLKNEEIEEKINVRIKAAAEELYDKDPPPYRGSKVLIAEGESLDIDLYTYVYFNESNVCSILLRKSLRSNDFSFYMDDVTALNFDLRTGEEITLADLFADHYDYQSAISEYVRNCISENILDDLLTSGTSEYNSGYTLLRPFEAVKEEQKFIIYSWDEVCLLLDYENREFDVGTQTRYLQLYSWLLPQKGEEFVFTEKYETWDSSLYKERFERRKSLKIDSDCQQSADISDHPMLENMWFRTSLPNSIENQQLALRLAESIGQAEDRAVAILEEYQLDTSEPYDGSYSFLVEKLGRYLTVSEDYSFWNNDDYIYGGNSEIYDSITGAKVNLEDCFVSDLDYRELVISQAMAMDQQLSREELVRALQNPQFMLYPTQFAITVMRTDSTYGLYESSVYLSFTDLGEENLTIFD